MSPSRSLRCKQTALTHVEEVVQAIIKLMDSPKAIGQVVNIGSVEEVSMIELAERIRV